MPAGRQRKKGKRHKKVAQQSKPDLPPLEASVIAQTKLQMIVDVPIGYTLDAENDVNTEITDTSIKIDVKDGRSLTIPLLHRVVEDKTQVKMRRDADKGDLLRMRLIKLTPGVTWDMVEAPDGITTEVEAEEKISKDIQESEKKDKDAEKDEVYELPWLHFDFYEKPPEVVVHLYVKQINSSTLQVEYTEDHLEINFQTSDTKFLESHEGSTAKSTFHWKIKLRQCVKPDQCSHKLSASVIEIHLAKAETCRWGILEATEKGESLSPKPESSRGVAFDEINSASNDSQQSSQSDCNLDNKQQSTTRESQSLYNLNEINRETSSQKPTAKVTPLSNYREGVTPGMTGLTNLGNTCFMNATLQVLANTRELRDYFTDGHFVNEINEDNPLGMQGHMAVAFATLLKALWSGEKQAYAPTKLKNLIAKKNTHFGGFAQHDAQEFLAYLLDGLHEDLNRIRKKPYTETVEDKGRPDRVVAQEAWDIYKKRNDSFIVDLFQGQFKSKLVCPECNKVSITFDPFMYVGVPLPKKLTMLTIIFMAKDPYIKPVKMVLRIPQDSSVEHVKSLISKKTNVHPDNLRIFETLGSKFHKIYDRFGDLSAVQSNDLIIVSEVLSEKLAGEPVIEIPVIQRTIFPNTFPTRCQFCKHECLPGLKLKRCTKCFRVGYCDVTCQGRHWTSHKTTCRAYPEPVGCPFVISVPQSRLTFSRLCQMMEGYARYSVDVFQPPVKMSTSASSQSDEMSHTVTCDTYTTAPPGDNSYANENTCDSNGSSESDMRSVSETDTGAGTSQTSLSFPPSESSHESVQITELGSDESTDGLPTTRGVADPEIISSGSGSSLDLPSPPSTDPSECDSSVDIADQNDMNDTLSNEASPGSQCYKRDQENTETTSDTLDNSASNNEQKNKSSSENDPDVSTNKTKTGLVMGVPQDELTNVQPAFYLKPVNQLGQSLSGPDGARIEDLGDKPLNLHVPCLLAMDWKNNEKLPSYVLIQSKELECTEDEDVNRLNSEDTGNLNLNQCLDLFTEPEVLSPQEAWYCPQCKAHREATKQMSLWRLPHILIVQLKRFSFRNFIWRDKIDSMVEFPIRNLDLSRLNVGNQEDGSPIYDLYGVVNHHGGILGGHYTAYVRLPHPQDNRKCLLDWRLCDDSRVYLVHEKQVVTRSAYVLFYIRRNSTIPFPVADLDKFLEKQNMANDTQTPVRSDSDTDDDEHTVPQMNLGTSKDIPTPLVTTPSGNLMAFADSNYSNDVDNSCTNMDDVD